jgi:hypothetical protein
VGPTPYYIEIYNSSTGSELASCGSGSSCQVSVSASSAQSDRGCPRLCGLSGEGGRGRGVRG